MHPAPSVILFTTLSGAGYGLWFWLGLSLIGSGEASTHGNALPLALLLGFVLVSAGLASSLGHLGQPQRAWRALSQWQTSWLSREGVLALATYLPAAMLFALWWRDSATGPLVVGLGLALALLCVATVACTAMIYASLEPIPAWRQPLVPVVYLGFALVGGGFIAVLLAVALGHAPGNMAGLALALGAIALGVLKRRYWRAIDRDIALPSLASATGLPDDRAMRAWEAPHTETSYLLREMGFVLARRHAVRLRVVAQWLFAWLPALLAFPLYLLPHADEAMLRLTLGVATASCLLGALVERWLFFAQARHVVSVYYGDRAR